MSGKRYAAPAGLETPQSKEIIAGARNNSSLSEFGFQLVRKIFKPLNK